MEILEIKDNMGFTPLMLAVRSLDESTRGVRSLLLKGARRDSQNNEGDKAIDLIKDNLPENMKRELISILK